MPELKCTVQTCRHNDKFYCDMDQIEVDGSRASSPKETCCKSFEERKDNGFQNSFTNGMTGSTKEASPTSTVDCKAKDCTYNESCHCCAGKISVEGGSACKCQDTMCASFRCE